MPYVKVSFDKLIFWNKNPRIASTNAKQEEIKDAIANLNPKKLLNLCKAIIKYEGLIEPLLIDPNNIVYDGNRRLTALSVLNNPEFAPADIKKAVEKLISANQNLIKKISAEIECRQESDLDLINLIIDGRHATDEDGLKRITWGPLERQRRNDPNAFILKLIEFADNNGLILPDDGFSTFERIIDTKEVGAKLQTLWKNLPSQSDNIIKIMKEIYKNIHDRSYNTRTLGTAQQIKANILPIIDNLCGTTKTNLAEEAKPAENVPSMIQPSLFPETRLPKTATTKIQTNTPFKLSKAGVQKSTDRKCLILKNSCLPDTSHLNKINDIVNELRTLKLQDFPIAGALLFRTLLELSTDHFLDFHNRPDNGLKLKQKLQKAISIIQQNNNYPEDGKTLDILKNDIQNGNEDVSITKLNTFVHNDMLPNPKTLILQYINMEKLIAFMLSDVK